MKKVLSFILILTLVISCVSIVTFTVSATTYGDLTYKISNGEVTITDCNTSASGEMVIPATIEGYPVTSIGSYAFYDCDSLKSVTIPDSVTSIGSYAFQDCSSLKSITIPDSVTSIELGAFSNCSSLTSITIPDSVTSIGDWVFYVCDSLTSVTIPDSVTSIGDLAFYYCDNLTSITIPDSVTSIGDRAFYYCDSLKTVYYTGKISKWYNVAIGSGNTPLTNANIIYNCPIIKVEKVNGVANSTVEVDINLNKNFGIKDMKITLDYDKNYLTLTDVVNGNVFADDEWTKGNITNENYVLNYSAEDDILTVGTLATLKFKVNKNAPLGKIPITVTFEDGDITNIDDEKYHLVVYPGKVTIDKPQFIYGDVNSDTFVNKKDDLAMRKYLADPAYEIDLEAANVFYDDAVNKKDLLRLKQHLADPDVVLGK